MPAAIGTLLLFLRSQTSDQMMVALIYGSALILLFCVSTAFHCVFYCNKDLVLKDVLHRMDRAMIYIFIAGSYFPWLNLGHTQHPYIICSLKWWIWVLAILGIIYQQVRLRFEPGTFKFKFLLFCRCSMRSTKVWKRCSIC